MATTTAPTPSQPLPGTDASKGIKKRKPGIKDGRVELKNASGQSAAEASDVLGLPLFAFGTGSLPTWPRVFPPSHPFSRLIG
ncbi:unnamed protein product [Larinioides sclopetarius]|uniref:Uncharacterized protein n=1 Tax=Larinioides sclopetarius TaxID=280406 RepID=A0AAV1YWY7_9ARAC